MRFCLGGVIGFGLFIVYDVNSVVWKKKILHSFFLFGCLFIAASTVLGVLEAVKGYGSTKASAVWLVIAAGFLGVLIYTLFFALPFKDTYQNGQEKSNVCSQGMYALCRHPGVLWFFFFYLCLGIGLRSGEFLKIGMVFSLCNLGYVIFQDLYTFPKILEGYDRYKKEVPFLIPDRRSITRAIGKAK